MSKIILFMFAGRRENMEVQMPYLRRILETHPEAVLHLWDLTRDPADADYLRTLRSDRIQIWSDLHPGHPIKCLYLSQQRRPRGWRPCSCLRHKPPYEQPYKIYSHYPESDDTIYVKIDDDVMFLETKRFDDLVAPLAVHPDRVISASVVNNAVCAKYLPELTTARVANFFAVGDPRNPANDRRWWELHTRPDFARYMHEWFLNEWCMETGVPSRPAEYVRTRPGEAVSINCIAFTHATMKRLAPMMNDRLGDEGAVDRLLPWICTSFMAAHLTFGPQDAGMSGEELAVLRKRYAELSRGYLG